MSSDAIDFSIVKHAGKSSLHFYNVSSYELELVLAALKIAREQIDMECDTKALGFLCMEYVSSYED